uniref:uncharacterized protein LOC118541031 isoform X2 n=1 Tax=Halichoerus grypus TaxID=9711 RepID=UPI00165A0EF2|nr:uncharacterized protein LOC118541031 isoform X2 [Halichoerus grypus]
MTWCALTVKQGGFAVVKMSASRETFLGRDLWPLSISASVRNLLRHVVANKKEIPDFNLMHGLWIFACLSCHGWSHFDKSVFQNTGKGWLSLLGPGNLLRKWDQKRQMAQNCLWESAETKLATGLSSLPKGRSCGGSGTQPFSLEPAQIHVAKLNRSEPKQRLGIGDEERHRKEG